MASKKSKRKRNNSTDMKRTESPQKAALSLRTLISSIQSSRSQDIKLANLKGLYMLLVQSSLNELREFDQNGLKLSLQDIYSLSHVLFEELESRIKRFLNLDNVSDRHETVRSLFLSEVADTAEELTLLLRCCMVILLVPGFDQHHIVEKGRVLLLILGRLVSVELSGGDWKSSTTFKESVSRERAYVKGDFTTSITAEVVTSISLLEPCDPWCILQCELLEVFADELLLHDSFRECFMLIDSASSRNDMLFMPRVRHDNNNIGAVLEVICAHFLRSVSNEKGFENFLNKLFWCHGESVKVPKMSLPAALSLLFNPIMCTAPKMLQAYVIILVSEAIGIHIPSKSTKLDLKHIEYYLSAFEKSVILYRRHMSCLHGDDRWFGNEGSFQKSNFLGSSCQLDFESYLRPTTREKVNLQTAKLDKAWDYYLSNIAFECKSELVAASVVYSNECLCSFEEPDKDRILSLLNCIIVSASSDDCCDTLLYSKGETSPQDIYLLASILKLMTSSLLKVTWHLQHLKFPHSNEDVYSCWEYQAVINSISCFEKYSIRVSIQKFLCELIQSHSVRHKEFKWMLLHFSGLLSLCYHSGVDFLVNACLFMVITTLNMLVIEKDFLHPVELLLNLRSESLSSKYADTVNRVPVLRHSSYAVSLKTQKIQEMYLRTRALVCFHEEKQNDQYGVESAVGAVENTVEKWDGRMFLNCVAGQNSQTIPDLDELANFIECEPGKDYSCWLRNRGRFRMWKHKKRKIFRGKKKKKIWNDLKRS